MENPMRKKYTAGLFNSMKHLVYADHFMDGDISWIGHKDDVMDYYPAYQYMFNQTNEFYDDEDDIMDINDFGGGQTDLVDRYLKPNPYQPKHIVTSLILENNNKATSKPHHQEKILRFDARLVDVIDLGDSRNFRDDDHVMDCIKKMQQASCYVGSPTSWDPIAKLYNIPTVLLWPL